MSKRETKLKRMKNKSIRITKEQVFILKQQHIVTSIEKTSNTTDGHAQHRAAPVNSSEN